MALYKYIARPEDVSHILEGRLKFTPPHELNDPSELTAAVDLEELRASLERYRREGYSEDEVVLLTRQAAVIGRLAPGYGGPPPRDRSEASRRIHHQTFDNAALLVGFMDRLSATMADNSGVLCLTQTPDSQPMWAHYAANATGLVVEFKGLEAAFAGDDTQCLGEPLPVRYTRGQELMTFDPRTYDTLFFTKNSAWSYECEVRVVLPLLECERVRSQTSSLYLRDVGRGHVQRIILGWRMPADRAAAIRQLVTGIDPSVEVVQATARQGRIELGA